METNCSTCSSGGSASDLPLHSGALWLSDMRTDADLHSYRLYRRTLLHSAAAANRLLRFVERKRIEEKKDGKHVSDPRSEGWRQEVAPSSIKHSRFSALSLVMGCFQEKLSSKLLPLFTLQKSYSKVMNCGNIPEPDGKLMGRKKHIIVFYLRKALLCLMYDYRLSGGTE